MFLGELAPASVTYHRRGLKAGMPEDLEGGAGWKWTTVLDVGIDARVVFSRAFFLDHVTVRLRPGAALAALEAWVPAADGGLQCVGRAAAAAGTVLEGSIVLSLGTESDTLLVRMAACFRDIAVEGIAVTGGAFVGPAVYPPPARMERGAGAALRPEDVRRIVVGDGASEDTLFAAAMLCEKILEDGGEAWPVVRAAEASRRTRGEILLGLWGEMAALETDLPVPVEEGYVLRAAGGSLSVCAADRRGLLYGTEAALSLLRAGPVPSLTIEDGPRTGEGLPGSPGGARPGPSGTRPWLRGVHLGLPPREEIPFFKRLIRELLLPMRYNTLFLEIGGGMEFERRPEIHRAWTSANRRAKKEGLPPVPHGDQVAGGGALTKAEVADLADYARSHGLEVIPEVQSFGHVQYLTMAYPDIAEREESPARAADLAVEDQEPDRLYPHCYCPSLEKSYEVIRDVIDEVVEAVRPERWVHMGHDEVYQIGICPRCRGKDPADLYALHVNRMHDYLAGKRLGMMIWSDMLQPSSPYRTPPAADRIPKDVVCLDFIWYFHFEKDLEDDLLSRGFRVVMGNMYSSHYPRYESRAAKAGMVGAEVSTWVRPDERVLGREGKLYDFLYSAGMMWSASYREDLRLCWDRMVGGLIPGLRSRLRGYASPSLAPDRRCLPLKLPSAALPSASPAARAVEPGDYVLRGVSFRVRGEALAVGAKGARGPSALSIRLDAAGRFDSLIFLHAAGTNAERIPWKELVPLAFYTVEFEDGRKARLPVEYGGNIGAWDRRYAEPLRHPFYRHQGYVATWFADPLIRGWTREGGPVTVYGWEWINPRPGVPLRAVTLSAAEGTDASVFLYAVTGVRVGK